MTFFCQIDMRCYEKHCEKLNEKQVLYVNIVLIGGERKKTIYRYKT